MNDEGLVGGSEPHQSLTTGSENRVGGILQY